jgi:hypothetical protein
MRRLFLVGTSLWAAVACDDTVFPVHGGGGGAEALPATAEGVAAFFEGSCVSCHPAEGSGSGGINLPGTIFDDVERGEEAWVVPGDPDASPLWWVLTDGGPEGQVVQMPLGRRDALDPAKIQHIRLWIYDGAVQ